MNEQQVRSLAGLSDSDAETLIKNEGYNELPSARRKNIFTIGLEVFREPMFLLLVSCGLIYLFLGDVEEAIMLIGFVFFIMGITIYQEGKTEKALVALRDLSSPRALVIRNGSKKRIAGREVVRGDYIILSEGDRVPADGIVAWEVGLAIDESLLTGESMPVKKSAGELEAEMQRPGGDNSPFVYSGTLTVQGQAVVLVKHTGINTEIGRIGKALQSVTPEETLLQKETRKIVKAVFIIAAVLCVLVMLVYGLTRGDWLNSVLSGITLAMAMLPEEFPVVLTIFLALGAWRLSQKRVLTRKMPAIETLGAATVLCVDKTGTITQNKMSVKKIFTQNRHYDVFENAGANLPEEFHELIEFAILASQKDPFDPMEKALEKLGRERLNNTEHLHESRQLLQQYPLSKELLALSHAWKLAEANSIVVAAKGAPEAIIDLCHLGTGAREDIIKNVTLMAGEGLRVLGIAKAYFDESALPGTQHDFVFNFVGLIGLEDPVRPAVPLALKECYDAGLRVVMITGDYPETAKNIARQIGLRNPDDVITGPELEKLLPEELRAKIKTANIFARVVPEQKLLIVNALKANGEIVAMTGDGVNDAPALKSAHIGISMGERGTDVAREASDLVLLDDDFSSIVEAVKMGRRIFDNLKKAMAYIISIHTPIALLSLAPVILKWKELIILPVHIVFLELIIDPACSIVFEAEPAEKDIMLRRPRNPKELLFGRKTLILSVLQGIFAFVIVMSVFYIAISLEQSTDEARALAFSTLIISNVCLILTNRNWSVTILSSIRTFNKALFWVIGGAILFLTIAVYVPFMQKLFHFAAIHPIDIAIALTAGLLSIVWFEVLKFTKKKNNEDIFR